MIQYKCFFCGADMESPESMAGKPETCPTCQKVQEVPSKPGFVTAKGALKPESAASGGSSGPQETTPSVGGLAQGSSAPDQKTVPSNAKPHEVVLGCAVMIAILIGLFFAGRWAYRSIWGPSSKPVPTPAAMNRLSPAAEVERAMPASAPSGPPTTPGASVAVENGDTFAAKPSKGSFWKRLLYTIGLTLGFVIIGAGCRSAKNPINAMAWVGAAAVCVPGIIWGGLSGFLGGFIGGGIGGIFGAIIGAGKHGLVIAAIIFAIAAYVVLKSAGV